MTQGPNFRFLIRDLAHELDAGRLTDLEAAGRVAEHIQTELRCMQVTFWSVSGEIGQRTMRSIAAYDGVRQRVVRGAAVFPEAGGGFFGAMLREGCYVCPDTFADPALEAVKQTMLIPFNIRALLAASYGGADDVWGLITCTNDTPRRWKAPEISALRRCAAEVCALRARKLALGVWLSSGSLSLPT